MKRQKICIIGGSLTGLVTAISLSKLNCDIDLIISNRESHKKSSRTIAISESNLNFLDSLNILKSFKKNVWACSAMKLYTSDEKNKFSEIFNLDQSKRQKKVFYMIENFKTIKLKLNKIKKINSISIKKTKLIAEINNSGLLKTIKIKKKNHKYNLIIICTGNTSELVKTYFNDKKIENSYREKSITGILSHNPIKNDIARQVFLEEGILAFLPISKKKTSIVFSLNKNFDENNEIIKKKILFYSKNYLANPSISKKLESRNLNFLLRDKYYKDRTLLFGDALHTIHPFVGQGFNMTLRDLFSLEKILRKKISLGMDIGSEDILSEFSQETKPRNFAFALGTDFLKSSFKSKKFRDQILILLNKNNFGKNIFFNIANKGLEF